ncbi:OstA-like protein [Bacteroidota bacterium]
MTIFNLPLSNYKSKRLRILSLLPLNIFIGFLFTFNTEALSQNDKIVKYTSDLQKYDEAYGKDITRLLGNVKITHEDFILSCDSAHFNEQSKSFTGFSNVYLNQNDSIHAYGDLIIYDHQSKLSKFRQNVRLLHDKTILTTNYLDHNTETKIAYYFNGGKIVDSTNILTSSIGKYFTEEKDFFFKDNAVLRNEEYLIKSDTLQYNSDSKISHFYGPTEIFSENNYIYSENGWYNTDLDIAQFNNDAFLQSGAQVIRGDSIYYDRKSGYGEAFNNVEITDSVENIILNGNYVFYNEKEKLSLLSGNTLFTQVADNDSLFLHADTLISSYDSTYTYRSLNAFHHVKFYRKDIQGKCDSLIYSFSDSIIHLLKEPVLWQDANQLTAKSILIYVKNREIEKIELNETAFIISREDLIHFNQIKGNKIIGYLKEKELYRIDVDGNGQTIYFTLDNGEIIGANKSESSKIVLMLRDKKLIRIKWIDRPDNALHPLDMLKENELFLEGWNWLDISRPKNKKDIFIWEY